MKVRMRTNLGTIDAASIGVDAAKCRAGMEPDVNTEAAQWLIGRRMANAVMHAVPPEPMQAVPPATVKPEAKPAPLAARGKPSDKPTSDKEA